MILKQLYIVKLSSYIKEQLKFALFLGVEGGGGVQNSLLKSPTCICNDKNQCFLMLNFSYKCDNFNKLEHFRKCKQKYNGDIVHFFSENFGCQK